MAAMEEIVAGLRRIVAAWVARAVMDGIVPVKIVIGVLSVPAAVVRLQCVVRPADASVRAPYHDTLSGETQRPDLWRMGVIDTRLDRRRYMRSHTIGRFQLREMILNLRIAFDSRHVRARCQRLRDLSGPFHKDCVNDVKRLVFKPPITQPLQDGTLCDLRLIEKRIKDKPPLFRLRRQTRGRTQVRLFRKHNKKFSLLTIGSMFQDPRRDLARLKPASPVAKRRNRGLPRRGNRSQDSDKSRQNKY